MLMCREKFVVELFFEAKRCDKFKDFNIWVVVGATRVWLLSRTPFYKRR